MPLCMSHALVSQVSIAPPMPLPAPQRVGSVQYTSGALELQWLHADLPPYEPPRWVDAKDVAPEPVSAPPNVTQPPRPAGPTGAR